MGRLLATIALACAVLAAGATSARAYPGCPAAKGPDLNLRAADNTRIAAHRWGTGRTAVVLVHQSGADLCQWAPYATRLASLGYRAFALDLRGAGRSQYRPLPAGLRFSADIAATVKEARQEGAKRVFVVGASLGGNAAVVAAANIRPLIDGVVSLSAPASFRLDAVEFDNVDGYANRTGFDLTGADQLTFDRRLADAAHSRGLGVGLKNDLDQVSQLLPSFDFSIDEQCAQYKECDALSPFVAAGKPVFEIEYKLKTSRFCAQAAALGFAAMRKHLALNAWRDPCP